MTKQMICLLLFAVCAGIMWGQTPAVVSGRTLVIVKPGDANWPRGGGPAVGPSGALQLKFDWMSSSSVPLDKTGNYSYSISGVNDILYQYQLSASQSSPSTDDISQLSSLSSEITQALSTASGAAPAAAPAASTRALTNGNNLRAAIAANPAACASFQQGVTSATADSTLLSNAVNAIQPKQATNGVASIPLRDTLVQWKLVISQYNALTDTMQQLHTASSSCPSAAAAFQTLVDSYMALQDNIKQIDLRASGAHIITSTVYLDRTKNGTITVTETYNGTPTQGSPRTFSLLADFSQMTGSGGFLISTIQNRSYASVSSPSSTPPSSVLQVTGASGPTPALVVLLNYHDPFDWKLNRPNFGLTASAGPVIGVTNGKADTSVFGVFAGISLHLYKRYFVTSGVHVGQYAGFPQGFTHAGQTIPTNFGTLSPTKYYTARLAFAVTFRGKDPSTVLGNSSSTAKAASTTAAPTTPGAKQQ